MTPTAEAVPPDLTRILATGRRVVVGAAVLLLLWLAVQLWVSLETTWLFYSTTGHPGVFTSMLWAKGILGVVTAVVAAAVVGAALVAFHRTRPPFDPDYQTQPYRWGVVRFEQRVRRPALVIIVGVLAWRLASRAATGWQLLLAWRAARPWGVTDSHFHRDASYYVSVLPFHRLLVTTAMSIVVNALAVVLLLAYPLGAVGWRRRRPWMAPGLRRVVSGLLALWVPLFAIRMWQQRYETLVTTGGPVTGASWTDLHARIPGRTVLVVVAVLATLLLVVTVVRPSWRLLATTLVVLAAAQVATVSAYPYLVQRFQESPSESRLDLPEIAASQRATLHAFGLDGGTVSTAAYGVTAVSADPLATPAARAAQVRVLDPNTVSPTFNVKQQIESYYTFKSTLDIDRYPIGGRLQDVAIAVRELNGANLPRSSWDNSHLVYTHGYGVVAARTDAVDERTGEPRFVNGGLPPTNAIPVTVPQVYYGQNLPGYAIVGRRPGSTRDRELDHPATTSGAPEATTTYAGAGGIPLGGLGRRLLFALRYRDASILMSREIGEGSRIIARRDPRARVSALAPWLTPDGDVYPVVVDGRISWVVDASTTSSGYPESQQIDLAKGTASSLVSSGSSVAQPSRTVNYMRGSVKAVVDAYDGTVRLYEWNQAAQPDPLLRQWERVYPGLVRPQSEIPAGLLAHLRYPSDLFGMQRTVLARYHVSSPSDFYAGSGFWRVPTDPTVAASKALNSGSGGGGTSIPLAGVYATMSPDGEGAAPTFSLSSPMVTLNQRTLAAIVTVDSRPGPTYGHFTVLQVPAGASFASPSQIQNDIESSNPISRALTLQRGGNSSVILGNLLTIPLAGRVLYVEPVYTRAAGGGSFPVLRHVIAVYGDGAPAFEPTLDAAVRAATGAR